MVPTGRSPEVPSATLREWGFNVAIYPALGMGVATAAPAAGYKHLQAQGHTMDMDVPSYKKNKLHQLVGIQDGWALERRPATEDDKGNCGGGPPAPPDPECTIKGQDPRGNKA